jgi:hypothetical protein
MAEGSEMADRSSEADGGCWGKFAVTGVDSDKVGLTDMMAMSFDGENGCQVK